MSKTYIDLINFLSNITPTAAIVIISMGALIVAGLSLWVVFTVISGIN